ncbi:MAG TPA: hydroxyacid dehydrogenase [Bacteroidales bacterium]|nr:MAG: hydroxyacid dehydrogenase [Bacteroidetes bacterium GWF2_33_38]OFY75111.1 MAG: hydroxyacid dehydrogenase [Bacteroidetes bacterium RIFOXYA12_FULL_33_9]OFY85767.1 MAG: hydroxyacid dehydrogenase [Bacteroidetes bacterium RIFOXYA2_FULL_33_7]HBF88419.1 hydroxyacid dehydrogenase [Bacteroidales bacterium]
MKPKILISDTIHPVLEQKLIEAGFIVDTKVNISYNDLLKQIINYDVLVVRSRFKVSSELIDAGSKLQIIARLGSGLENIDVDYAKSKNIECLNSPEGNRDSLGEHAIGMLLSLLNNISTANNEIRKGIWNRKANWGVELKGKTIGILGYGNMGSAFAERLSGFGVNVIAYDKYKQNYSNSFVEESSMIDLFEKTDILSIHLPYNKETHYLVNNTFINNFKKNLYIVNTARGKILNTEDLVSAMKEGKILGAALDVIEYEDLTFEKFDSNSLPEPFQYLAKSNNVILTPHVAGWSSESNFKLADILASKIIDKLK